MTVAVESIVSLWKASVLPPEISSEGVPLTLVTITSDVPWVNVAAFTFENNIPEIPVSVIVEAFAINVPNAEFIRMCPAESA
jgi:hypothetical protein